MEAPVTTIQNRMILYVEHLALMQTGNPVTGSGNNNTAGPPVIKVQPVATRLYIILRESTFPLNLVFPPSWDILNVPNGDVITETFRVKGAWTALKSEALVRERTGIRLDMTLERTIQ